MTAESRIRSNIIYRLANGMIDEKWPVDDSTTILHQVAACTPPWLGGSQS
jgi:hypothetical protein